jgi:hypothetical protein
MIRATVAAVTAGPATGAIPVALIAEVGIAAPTVAPAPAVVTADPARRRVHPTVEAVAAPMVEVAAVGGGAERCSG